MSGTRLFVGGLSPNLSDSVLRAELTQFGSVIKIDIKEKKDLVTGAVLKRFAFVTLDAPHSKIEQCKYLLCCTIELCLQCLQNWLSICYDLWFVFFFSFSLL